MKRKLFIGVINVIAVAGGLALVKTLQTKKVYCQQNTVVTGDDCPLMKLRTT